MLDVNAGIPLVDEAELLATMLQTVQVAVDVPICIDSSVIEALEAGLAAYEGRALVNSVTAEDEPPFRDPPARRPHGAAVIGLANDETGIPETPRSAWSARARSSPAAADYGIAPRRCRDRPAGHDRRRRPEGGEDDAEHDQPDPRRARGQHVPGRVERVVRAARSPRAERRVPADGDGRRADQRDHVDRSAGGRRGAGGRPAARPRRVGRKLDRGASRPAGRRWREEASVP